MNTYYFAAHTEGECLVGCEHKHKTLASAVACIDSAGGYVVAVEKRKNGRKKSRELNSKEEREFRRLMYSRFGIRFPERNRFLASLLAARRLASGST
jgi:hypothetical protein